MWIQKHSKILGFGNLSSCCHDAKDCFNLLWLADLAKPELAVLIAAEVRRLHDLEIPGPKDPQLWVDIHKFIEKGVDTCLLFYLIKFAT